MDVIDEIEQEFLPKPGGMIDRHREEKARKAAMAEERVNADVPVEEPAARAVKVTEISPENFVTTIVTIPAGGTAQVLPLNPYRHRAAIRIVTAASTVSIAKDAGAALGGTGFPLLTADAPLPLFTRGQVYALNPGGSAVQVAVISESYAPEKTS